MSSRKSFQQMFGLTLVMLLLVGCGGVQAGPTPTPTSVPPTATPTPVPATPTPTSVPPTPTPTSAAPENSKVTIYYAEQAQFELISSQGTRVLIDVFNPSALTSPVTEKDVLLTTHSHDDHINTDFANSFPGQQLRIREGEINLPDVTIKGIASTHTAREGDEFKPEGGTNYIFIVDIEGLRIAHLGDIGQDQLTQEQLDVLGKVDIVFTQLVNAHSEMDLENKKGFNIIAQVKPKLIIATHGRDNRDAIKYAMELWEVFAMDAREVTLGPSDLSGTTKLLVLGDKAPPLKETYGLPDWPEPASAP